MNATEKVHEATFIGIDAHRWEHTALAINRFFQERGRITVDNTHTGIAKLLSWIPTVDGTGMVYIGVEGGGTERHALLRALVGRYVDLYEINPLYTRQRRDYGTHVDKSDARDAKLVAEVLTTKVAELPKILPQQLAADRLVLKKSVWFYEEIAERGAAIQHHLRLLERETALAEDRLERQALRIMMVDKTQELKRIRKTQAKLKKTFAKLLPTSGKNLITMPGINIVLAAKITAHIDGIERFANVDKFIRYAGIAPVEKSSGNRKRYIKANRGNRKLNSALYMAALSQRRFDPKASAYVDKKVSEGKTKKHALRCLMKRVACIVYGMLKSGEPYRQR